MRPKYALAAFRVGKFSQPPKKRVKRKRSWGICKRIYISRDFEMVDTSPLTDISNKASNSLHSIYSSQFDDSSSNIHTHPHHIDASYLIQITESEQQGVTNHPSDTNPHTTREHRTPSGIHYQNIHSEDLYGGNINHQNNRGETDSQFSAGRQIIQRDPVEEQVEHQQVDQQNQGPLNFHDRQQSHHTNLQGANLSFPSPTSHFLDMLSADMDFEQAYAMYTTLQPQRAVSSVEQLEKMQLLNQQYVASLQTQQAQGAADAFPGNSAFSFGQQNDYLYDRAAITQSYLFAGETPKKDEFDQFFSNSESNQLEAFLDNLASNPPTHLYNKNKMPSVGHDRAQSPGTELNDMFDLYTMQTFSKREADHVERVRRDTEPVSPMKQIAGNAAHGRIPKAEHELLKKELTEAFSYPHLKSFVGQLPQQLPTPVESRETSFDLKRRAEDEDDDEPKRRRRSSSKSLLLLEQKRLNHLHLEQRRRQMCKLAYERCLRLIVNIDAFNKLPPESPEMQKKTKRARVNKDGLPNLSKHSALMRISNEICTIKDANSGLRLLLESKGVKYDGI